MSNLKSHIHSDTIWCACIEKERDDELLLCDFVCENHKTKSYKIIEIMKFDLKHSFHYDLHF